MAAISDSGDSSPDSLASLNDKFLDTKVIDQPLKLSIYWRPGRGGGYDLHRESVISSNDDHFKIVAAALSNALLVLCTAKGQEAMMRVATDVSRAACRRFTESAGQPNPHPRPPLVMQRIANSKDTDAAYDWVVQFRRRLHSEFPVIFIDDAVDGAGCLGFVMKSLPPEGWNGSLQSIYTIHVSPWHVTNAREAFDHDDIIQYRNSLLCLQHVFCRDIGAHLLTACLHEPARIGTATPTAGLGQTSSGPSTEESSPETMTHAARALEQVLFGGQPCYVLKKQPAGVPQYQTFTPHIEWLNPADEDFEYVMEIAKLTDCIIPASLKDPAFFPYGFKSSLFKKNGQEPYKSELGTNKLNPPKIIEFWHRYGSRRWKPNPLSAARTRKQYMAWALRITDIDVLRILDDLRRPLYLDCVANIVMDGCGQSATSEPVVFKTTHAIINLVGPKEEVKPQEEPEAGKKQVIGPPPPKMKPVDAKATKQAGKAKESSKK